MSDITFDCPFCATSFKVDACAVEMRVDCPTCGLEIEILEPTDRAEGQHQEISKETKQNETEPDKQMPLSASDFRKVLEEASATIVGTIDEASRQMRSMIGD